jgi:hypothetical protein
MPEMREPALAANQMNPCAVRTRLPPPSQCGERIELKRGARRCEKDDEHGQRAAFRRFLEAVAPAGRDVLHDQTGGKRREQWFDVQLCLQPGDQAAHREQRERDSRPTY